MSQKTVGIIRPEIKEALEYTSLIRDYLGAYSFELRPDSLEYLIMQDWILINNSKNAEWPKKKEWRILEKLLPENEQKPAELKESVLLSRRKYIINTIVQNLGTDYGRSQLLEFYKDQGVEFYPLYVILESKTNLA